MYDLQKIFDDCCAVYERCMNNIREMSYDVANYMEKEGVDWDPNITCAKFDIALQYSLLQIASSDLKLDENELIFVRDIAEEGDFLAYINSIGNTNITWESLFSSNIFTIRKLLRGLEGAMGELSEEFVRVFAVCDKATEYDFVADLERDLLAIVAGLINIDGTVSRSEMNEKCLILGTIDRIKKIKNE